jgi:hypothetical protein
MGNSMIRTVKENQSLKHKEELPSITVHEKERKLKELHREIQIK